MAKSGMERYKEYLTIHDTLLDIEIKMKTRPLNMDFNGGKKEDIGAFVDGSRIGYLTYYNGDNMVFSGMEIQERYRGMGFSNLFMNQFFFLGEGKEFLAKQQRKPIMAYILVNHGFKPVSTDYLLSISVKKLGHKLGLYFHDQERADIFFKGRLNTGIYTKLFEPINESVCIRLPSEYEFTSKFRLEDRIYRFNQRFEVM